MPKELSISISRLSKANFSKATSLKVSVKISSGNSLRWKDCSSRQKDNSFLCRKAEAELVEIFEPITKSIKIVSDGKTQLEMKFIEQIFVKLLPEGATTLDGLVKKKYFLWVKLGSFQNSRKKSRTTNN